MFFHSTILVCRSIQRISPSFFQRRIYQLRADILEPVDLRLILSASRILRTKTQARQLHFSMDKRHASVELRPIRCGCPTLNVFYAADKHT